MDKRILSAVLVVVGALGASFGFDFSPDEQGKALEFVLMAVAGVSGLYGLGRTVVVRRNRKTAEADAAPAPRVRVVK